MGIYYTKKERIRQSGEEDLIDLRPPGFLGRRPTWTEYAKISQYDPETRTVWLPLFCLCSSPSFLLSRALSYASW